MSILFQPDKGNLGSLLIDRLNMGYKQFVIFSAFAKNSGVLRLKPQMETFRANGGEITAFIGIDLDGTSYEALLNLFGLCDNLYVIHSENFATTYHNKVYLLSDNRRAWCAIGSNNLTGGGLWTNFEACIIREYTADNDPEGEWKSIQDIQNIYEQEDYPYSLHILSKLDIDMLLENEYITRESSQRMSNIAKKSKSNTSGRKDSLFGHERIMIPLIIENQHNKRFDNISSNSEDHTDIISLLEPSFNNEQFWFEMRAGTGGSRNILDLSKLGKIKAGTVKGTKYEYSDTSFMYGGVKFFDLDPENTSVEKDITINYQGKDYYPSTIKFTPGNGSWRIQLKGTSQDGTEELSKHGNQGEFVHKILVFEKINPDYYSLTLLEESELERLKSISKVWARNGNGNSSKAYGMF